MTTDTLRFLEQAFYLAIIILSLASIGGVFYLMAKFIAWMTGSHNDNGKAK